MTIAPPITIPFGKHKGQPLPDIPALSCLRRRFRLG
jgi:hypothetical protein